MARGGSGGGKGRRLRVTVSHIRVTIGFLRVNIGYFFFEQTLGKYNWASPQSMANLFKEKTLIIKNRHFFHVVKKLPVLSLEGFYIHLWAYILTQFCVNVCYASIIDHTTLSNIALIHVWSGHAWWWLPQAGRSIAAPCTASATYSGSRARRRCFGAQGSTSSAAWGAGACWPGLTGSSRCTLPSEQGNIDCWN